MNGLHFQNLIANNFFTIPQLVSAPNRELYSLTYHVLQTSKKKEVIHFPEITYNKLQT